MVDVRGDVLRPFNLKRVTLIEVKSRDYNVALRSDTTYCGKERKHGTDNCCLNTEQELRRLINFGSIQFGIKYRDNYIEFS